MAERVIIKEVGPRDGLQNEPGFVPTSKKVELVNRLTEAGFQHIEVSSFVNPKWIPALSDASLVFEQISRGPGVEYSALVPNEMGLERALQAGVDVVNVFMSASETHNRKNINKTIDETFRVLHPVIAQAKAAGKPVRGYVSTVFGCPYEGKVALADVLKVCYRLFEMGLDELSLGDTIGVAVPPQVTEVVRALTDEITVERLALHFHDTRGMAMANVMAGFAEGVRTFDSSIGGLGGCPYAPGASGNVATDDLLYLFNGLGVDTGIDGALVAETTKWFETALGRPLPSHARAIARGQEGGVHCD